MKKSLAPFLLLALFLTSCTSKSSSSAFSTEKAVDSDLADSRSPASAANSATINKGGGRPEGEKQATVQQISLEQARTQDVQPTTRKIVRNADLKLEAASPEASQQKITAIAETNGGFVVESQQSSSNIKTTTRDTVTLTLRVPAEKFAGVLDEIRKSVDRVIVETVKGDDVTEEFLDVEARLKAKKALEEQFLEIMKRANSVDDALNVQRQLGEVRGEIERIEGRKRFLENQAALSTIKIRIQTPAAFSANSSGFFYRLTDSFSTGLDFALNFVLGLVTLLIGILPFILLIGLPAYFIVRYFWRRRRRARSAMQIAEEEIKSE